MEASNRATAPPVERSYSFRTTGSIEFAGQELGLFPKAIRTVQKAARIDDSTYTFDVLDELATLKTLNRYRVVTGSAVALPQKGEAGLFITETVRGDGNDNPTTFTWTPPIALARFPIERGDAWDVHSTALDGQVVMSFSARVGEEDPERPGEIVRTKVRVDACGEFIDAWNIQVGVNDATGSPSGRYVGPGTLFSFSESYAIAPQYGGLVVMERRSLEGQSNGVPTSQERESIIDVVPAVPE